MKKIKKLKLSKETIISLDNNDLNQVKGGNQNNKQEWYTVGCTDGCGPFATAWRCTSGNCTYDCSTLECTTEAHCGGL